MPDPILTPIPGFADPFSSLTHLIGAVVFAGLAIPLVRHGWTAGHTARRVASLVIFSASAVLLLSMSGVFHLLDAGSTGRVVMQRFDHAAIFILIAGTFTPIHTILFKGPWRWGMLAFIWLLAIAGVTLKTIFFRSTGTTLGLCLYVGMGWVGAISSVLIGRQYGARLVMPLLLGGVVYTLGALIELFEPRAVLLGVIRSHELFHVAVLGGLAFHWRLVWLVAATGSESNPRAQQHDGSPVRGTTRGQKQIAGTEWRGEGPANGL